MDSPLIMAAKAKRAALRGVRRASDAALDLVRRGDRMVIETPAAGLRFGNFLYLWLQAHLRTAEGRPTLVREARGMEPWRVAFPMLSDLTIESGAVRFGDRREWDAAWLYQRYGVDFTTDQLDSFVRTALAPHVVPDSTGTLVMNVRRGDYYSQFTSKYAFDQIGYLAAALERVDDVERVLVVSDDADWCRENLDELVRSRAGDVEYARPDPLANFLAVAGASRIIGTNSTFTYWAAYVAGVVHPGATIVMPRFHGRMAHGTAAHQLDPRWIAIDGFD